jgi:BirA family biotin operon repressor/biotin-[acetyl-CoA-carboxylase] ligase
MNNAQFEQAVAGLPFEKVAFFPTIGSTNDVVTEWARQGLRGLALAAADEQTRGRGRAGRRWLTPPGSALAFSLSLEPAVNQDAGQLGRASGLGALAVSEGLENQYGLKPEIKWPNDVLLDGKKTAGVLAESHWVGDRLQALVLGIGINVAPESVPAAGALNFPATSVEQALGRAVDKAALLRSVLEALIGWKARLSSAEFLQAWESRLAYLGQSVRLETGAGPAVEAQLDSLASDGSLKLRLSSGEVRVYQMGEVQLRPAIDTDLK